MASVTTIQITKETKEDLNKLKERQSETYEEVIRDLIELAEEDHLELSAETKKGIQEGREAIKKGRFYTTEQLIKELGI